MFLKNINQIPDKIRYTMFEMSKELTTSPDKMVELFPDKIILSRIFNELLKEAIVRTIPKEEKIINYRIPEIRVAEASAVTIDEGKYEVWFVLKVAVQHRTLGVVKHESILHHVPILERYINDHRFEKQGEPNVKSC